MDPAGFEKYNQLYLSLMKDVIQAAPSTASLLTNIGEEVLAGQYYVALKQAMKLVKYEKELVSHVGQSA
jgi:flagellar protein FlbT